MNSFHYHRAGSLNEAAQRLSGNDQARLLAGGMTLIPSLKHRLLAVSELIDIARLPDLQDIRIESQTVWVGAAVRRLRGPLRVSTRFGADQGSSFSMSMVATVSLRLSASFLHSV